jgi:C4-dicarboxylate transporter DctM subunit
VTSSVFVGLIGFAILILCFLLGVPVGFSMALVGILGFGYLTSIESTISMTGSVLWSTLESYSLSVLPMFVLMGAIAFQSGISTRLYVALEKLFGRLRGGLAIATVFACAGFSAICGSSAATAATIGRVSLPEMRKHNYASSLSAGCVASAGTLGILIPPSTMLIIYASMTEQSIAELFAAGVIPGMILAILFAVTIFALCLFNPALAPPSAKFSLTEKLASLRGVIDTFCLVIVVLGGLFIGFFTPTEAGGVGAAGVLVIALARRSITWHGFLESLKETTRISCMILFILSGAFIFSRFMAISRLPFDLSTWVGTLPLPTWAILVGIVLIYLIGGCFMDALGLVTLTVPVFYPMVLKMGVDPIWFGVTIVLITEMGAITPPVGINVYVIKGIVSSDVSMETIFWGIWPFLGALVFAQLLFIAFPNIVTFFPNIIK